MTLTLYRELMVKSKPRAVGTRCCLLAEEGVEAWKDGTVLSSLGYGSPSPAALVHRRDRTLCGVGTTGLRVRENKNKMAQLVKRTFLPSPFRSPKRENRRAVLRSIRLRSRFKFGEDGGRCREASHKKQR